jgi:hypothetical protein
MKDGVSLRFAMVHDVIHERFPRHGTAYYQERNRRTRAALTSPETRPSPQDFERIDNLAVGLEMVGEHDAAIQLMRDKLKQQLELKIPRNELYSTHANLGTFLILGPFRQVRPGNEQDKATLREGLKCIETAIEINPDSHFGREEWQSAIIRYMIVLYDQPDLLLKFDMVGNAMSRELPEPVQPHWSDGYRPREPIGGRHPSKDFGVAHGGVAAAQAAAKYVKHPQKWEQFSRARDEIARLVPIEGWPKNPQRKVADEHGFSLLPGVPFDEPTLGIIGMWRLGGGAHPYFAVALGEIMLRVGQNYIAWTAFERAARMATIVWPDPKLQEKFAEHCRQRQKLIEGMLPAEEVAKLRPAFEQELAFGQNYQRMYQQYEAERIGAGSSIEDPHFYDDLNAKHGPIASPVGDADWFRIGDDSPVTTTTVADLALLFAGLFALGSVLLRRPAKPQAA